MVGELHGGPAVLRRDADAQVPHLAAAQGAARRHHIELIRASIGPSEDTFWTNAAEGDACSS